jgi:solute carrier family 41
MKKNQNHQHWELFKAITAIFTLIPALLGLKGNLEMTLASRFSTQVYMGEIAYFISLKRFK